jgi:hypothetical protein
LVRSHRGRVPELGVRHAQTKPNALQVCNKKI